jgi:hypothetical protein
MKGQLKPPGDIFKSAKDEGSFHPKADLRRGGTPQGRMCKWRRFLIALPFP